MPAASRLTREALDDDRLANTTQARITTIVMLTAAEICNTRTLLQPLPVRYISRVVKLSDPQ
jgi:hypothetical protein